MYQICVFLKGYSLSVQYSTKYIFNEPILPDTPLYLPPIPQAQYI